MIYLKSKDDIIATGVKYSKLHVVEKLYNHGVIMEFSSPLTHSFSSTVLKAIKDNSELDFYNAFYGGGTCRIIDCILSAKSMHSISAVTRIEVSINPNANPFQNVAPMQAEQIPMFSNIAAHQDFIPFEDANQATIVGINLHIESAHGGRYTGNMDFELAANTKVFNALENLDRYHSTEGILFNIADLISFDGSNYTFSWRLGKDNGVDANIRDPRKINLTFHLSKIGKF